jgi:hypothetical protein
MTGGLEYKKSYTLNVVFSVTNPICLARYCLETAHVVSMALNVNLTKFVIP